MKCLVILLTVACVCLIISAQHDEDPYSGLGHLKTRLEAKLKECGKSYLEGCLTRVTSPPSGSCQCAPYLDISSGIEENGQLGGSMSLYCLFFGFPLPAITWNRPHNRLPTGRYQLSTLTTSLTLNDITASDEGNYTCSATNVYGHMTHTLRMRVVAAPVFKNKTNGPCNTSVTEGESATFNCIPFAIPEANITWLQNGRPIDTENPPERFVFSNDNRSLTIRNVCRDCVDRESKTDIMVIQCDASNVHGYAFAQGHLNVLTKTNAWIRGLKDVSVDFLKDERFVFQCITTSDPSRASTVRWYKTEPFGDLVRDEPPYVYVTKDILVIMFPPNCSTYCSKYLGEYRCDIDIGCRRGSDTITLTYHYRPSPVDTANNEETLAVWKTILVAGAIGLLLLLILMFLDFLWKRRFGDLKRQTKEGRLPNPTSIYEDVGYEDIGYDSADPTHIYEDVGYEDVGYESVDPTHIYKDVGYEDVGYEDVGYDSFGLPLEERVDNRKRSMTRESGEYDRIGYDSIDKVLEEITDREYAMSDSLNVSEHNRFVPLDAPQREAIGRERLTVDKGIAFDDMGYLRSLDETKHCRDKGKEQLKPEELSKSNEQSESANTESSLNWRKDNKLYLITAEMKSHSELLSKEMNPYLDLEPNEMNQYLNLEPNEVKQYLDQEPNEMCQHLDLGPKKVNQYLNLKSNEMNHYLDLGPNEVNQFLDLEPNEANQYMHLDPKEKDSHLYLSPSSTELNLEMLLGRGEV